MSSGQVQDKALKRNPTEGWLALGRCSEALVRVLQEQAGAFLLLSNEGPETSQSVEATRSQNIHTEGGGEDTSCNPWHPGSGPRILRTRREECLKRTQAGSCRMLSFTLGSVGSEICFRSQCEYT